MRCEFYIWPDDDDKYNLIIGYKMRENKTNDIQLVINLRFNLWGGFDLFKSKEMNAKHLKMVNRRLSPAHVIILWWLEDLQ